MENTNSLSMELLSERSVENLRSIYSDMSTHVTFPSDDSKAVYPTDDDVLAFDRPQRTVTSRDLEAFLSSGQIFFSGSEFFSGNDESESTLDENDVRPLDRSQQREMIRAVNAFLATRQINPLETTGTDESENSLDDDDVLVLDPSQRTEMMRVVNAFLAARQINPIESSGNDESTNTADDDGVLAPDRPLQPVIPSHVTSNSVASGGRRPARRWTHALNLSRSDDTSAVSSVSRRDFRLASMQRLEADQSARSDGI
eukprot:TRINITY_DN23117_c0_g1_i1.p1 TRINITY_DN23117_c0_g1~~TRINITY_DN23117_c0_g1_i1.p1  ORF type:complete len:257 (-),score=27.17 TRINITY_DN23117_c0_g1_i1:239-1009(-)